jgi:uncharacterized delta-60 repeat protein
MEENIQDILKDKDENVVQFNFQNNTSTPVAVDLFNTASLVPVPTSGSNQTTQYTSTQVSTNIAPSTLAVNPNNGLIMAIDSNSALRVVNSTTNTTNNNFDNVIGFDGGDANVVVIQNDGKILVGGSFNQYKNVSANSIIRLNPDGTKDLTFDNSIGFNNLVAVITIQSDGKILVGGDFTTYKGVSANRIIRLNPNGTIDLTFNYGIGFNDITRSIAIQSDGKILVGGFYTTYKGISEVRIIRLNSDGSKDLSFNNSIGFDSTARALFIQSDGKIICGGNFTTYKGISENRIIRLNPDGSKDLSFNNSIGFNNTLNSIAIQSDGKIICGGNFTTYKGVLANSIIRLNTDGTIDSTFNYGIGFNNPILTNIIQPDGKILVGGLFTQYKGLTENRIIRLNSDGSKDLTFDNSVAFDNNVLSIALQTNGDIICVGFFNLFRGFRYNSIIKLNTFCQSLSYLNLDGGGVIRNIAYNPSNNQFYLSRGFAPEINVLDGNGNIAFLNTAIPVSTTRCFGTSYNSNNNFVYYLCRDSTLSLNAKFVLMDCSTNTFVSTITLSNFDVSGLSNTTTSNTMYYFEKDTGLLQKLDCNINTPILINVTLPNISIGSDVTSIYFNSTNNYLYVSSVSSPYIDIIDTTTDTYVSSILFTNSFLPLFSTYNPITNQLFYSDFAGISNQKYAVVDCSLNSLVSVNVLSSSPIPTAGLVYNPITNSVYISGSLYSVVTFTASPFFIGGSTNYNTFVNSLNFEPIFVEEIRFITTTQSQLYNQVQFTKIDSNGNQIFFPEFPITKVDSYQAQGNIAELKLNGLVFDGRTYINQYVINPTEIVTFEIIYKQLDRFSATETFPIFFKQKVQLQEYIKKDYTDYDVEM